MAKKLRVVHAQPGYEAWKDQEQFIKPNLRAILTIVGGIFGCGVLSAGIGTTAWFATREAEPLPTVVSIEMITTPSATPAFTLVAALPTLPPVQPPTQTPLPVVSEQPDLEATLNYLVLLNEQMQLTTAEPTPTPIWCDGAAFDFYPVNQLLKVVMTEKGALRLLDRARVAGEQEPVSQKLIYNNWRVRVTGEPVCGAWNNIPMVYYPVHSLEWRMNGWVGFGQDGDVWLEPARSEDAQ